jgi:amino-acid N-acetyltransferase
MELRKAAMRDIPQILELINSYATQGVMLPRSDFELAESIRDFTVAVADGRLIGCAALHFYTPLAAEVRSLAVVPGEKGRGIGRSLVGALETEARECELASIFAFTYVPGFFAKLGFEEVDRGLIPLKAWKECLRCPKFQNCDEIAVLKKLREIAEPVPELIRPGMFSILTQPATLPVPALPGK